MDGGGTGTAADRGKKVDAPARTQRSVTNRGRRTPGNTELLWQRLIEARDLTTLASPWLELQCARLKGVVRAVVVRVADDESLEGVALWPKVEVDVDSLAPAVNYAITRGSGIVQRVPLPSRPQEGTAPEPLARIAYPYGAPGAHGGAVALELETSSDAALQRAMREIQWGAAWLEARAVQEALEASTQRAARFEHALEFLSAGIEEEGFQPACRALVTEFALRMRCDRVSIGFVRAGHCTVRSISNSARFSKRMNLVRMLGAAMDEAIDQRTAIVHPAEPDALHVTRAHRELARAHRCETILTVPIIVYDRIVGAICLERTQGRAFEAAEMESVVCVAAVAGPVLEEKRNNDRWIGSKVWGALADQMRKLLGPAYFKRKIVACTAIGAAIFCYYAEGKYQIPADAEVKGRIQRTVVAPFDGFVKEAHVRAGDVVGAGDLMVALDDSDLRLERFRWITERRRNTYEFERALGEEHRVESKIAQARIAQAQSSIDVLDQQIARARMTAPFDGVVVAGDLSQAIGAAVEIGEVLFEVAPLDAYRVTLEVDESQIRDVAPESGGQLRLTALPEAPFPVVVKQVTPVATVREGRTFFRVEAHIEGDVEHLRPNMSGVARIDAGERRVVWIWTRTFIDWLSIALWRWIG